MATWYKDILEVFKNEDRPLHLSEVYSLVKDQRRKIVPKNFKAIIRKEIEYHSSDSQAFQGKENNFKKLSGFGKGYWTLRNKKHSKTNKPEDWEIALIKKLILIGGRNEQDILAFFTRPNRSINHRCISEIAMGNRGKKIKPASNLVIKEFLDNWPNIDPSTGLSLLGDELVIKAREAMLLAIQCYNNPLAHFKSEVFIVLNNIAWTYALHAYFKQTGVKYTYPKKNGGELKYWDLSKCINTGGSPLSDGEKNNLSILIEIRNQIEHKMTTNIDMLLSAKLQASINNFDKFLITQFGQQCSISENFSLALQMEKLSSEQIDAMQFENEHNSNLCKFINEFEDKLGHDIIDNNDAYAVRYFFTKKLAKRKSAADVSMEFISDLEAQENLNSVYLKETERKKYRFSRVHKFVTEMGFTKFSTADLTNLVNKYDAKNNSSFSVELHKNFWMYYDAWLEFVINHCKEKYD